MLIVDPICLTKAELFPLARYVYGGWDGDESRRPDDNFVATHGDIPRVHSALHAARCHRRRAINRSTPTDRK